MKDSKPGQRVNSVPRIAMFALVGAMVLAGAGCSAPTADPLASDEVDFHPGASFTVRQTYLGFDAPENEGYGVRSITLDDWQAGQSAALRWSLKTRQETAASKAAREAAANVPIGTTPNIPDPVYEDVTAEGTVTTDALDNAGRVLLPSYWPDGEYDATDEENSVLWLSRAQYDELVSTSHSHIALGLFDSTLQDVLDFNDTVQSALARFQGEVAEESTTQEEITALTAESDWGDYIVAVNGVDRAVTTIEAENRFAKYVILANADNPLILQVTVKPLALGLSMISTLNVIKSLAGYEVTSITY